MVHGPRDPLLGAIVDGRWRVIKRIGAGAIGGVYLAERVNLGRPVALKLLHPDYSASSEFVHRFAREARVLSKLQHVNCVSILDVGSHQDRPYIVMELVSGHRLTEELTAGVVKPARAVGWMAQVLRGLSHAHGQGIVHRDLKPDNVMVTHLDGVGEVVKILDFGFAHINDQRVSQSNANLVPGTPSYMSPEQAQGHKADPRTDLYAAGVILYELCTGFRPFVAAESYEILRMHIEDAPVPPRTAASGRGISDALDKVILRALAKNPDERFADAEEMLRALEATPEGRSAKGGSHRALIWGGAAALLLLIGVIVALLVSRR